MDVGGSKIQLAVVAGVLATTGSLFGKIAGNFDFMPLVSSGKIQILFTLDLFFSFNF